MIDGLARLRILAVTRPEHPHLPLDLLVRNPRVVGDTALAGLAQLVEDFARAGEGESVRPPKRASQVLNDAPVLTGFARAVDGFVDFDNAAFDLRDRPF